MNDIKIVKSCPTSKEEWDKAAFNKKCNDTEKRKNCTDDENQLLSAYVYHCVINAYSNETLEVCARRRFIFGKVDKYLFWLSN